MDYMFNDLSFHGQFHSSEEFRNVVELLMKMRGEIRRCGSQLFCRRELAFAQVTPNITMPQAVNGLDRDKRHAWIQWLTQQGPFWSDDREHDDDDWLELDDEQIVTNTAIGEVAYRNLNSLPGELLTVDPSNWLRHPIRVIWKTGDAVQKAVDVVNHWTHASVSASLAAAPVRYSSWSSLEEHVRRKYERLTFAEQAFHKMFGHPYVPGAAERIDVLLSTLNDFKGCFDDNGNRTAEGDRIYANHFARKKGWFSDSSDAEKVDFKSDMTFPHPGIAGKHLFCTWHGKVKSPQIRIHFSSQITKDDPLFIVYVGPKITKR